MKKNKNKIIYSPSDLIRYVASPFASWMDRYYLENHDKITPDQETEDQKLIAQTGDQHEQNVLEEFKSSYRLTEISKNDYAIARTETLSAIKTKVPIIYQAALEDDRFVGFTDFLILDDTNQYQIWDTKLAHSPKPYYIIQLCCYSEMLAITTGKQMPAKFGIILGTKDKIEFCVEDFIHYYHQVRANFLAMQDGFTNNIKDCPEPLPGADHGRWTSHAEQFFEKMDHLVRVAGITIGQIKKLKNAGISTMTQLSAISDKSLPKFNPESLEKLIAQARLQCKTSADRKKDPSASAQYEVLSQVGANHEPIGLAILPPEHPADIYFDMEGYPLVPGGLEYLFGACSINEKTGKLDFNDWWAHNRNEEKIAFEGFIDWVYKKWIDNPGMHIYHYAAYEVSAVRRLSTRHDTRQDEVDNLLRGEVFIDLYQTVRHGLRIGENNYSIKSVEHLYRPKRSTEVATAIDSVVQYAHWIKSKQSSNWKESAILKNIRDYNEDDCKSTVELLQWLRKIINENNITITSSLKTVSSPAQKELSPEVILRTETIKKLREQDDEFSVTLADLVDFHRREEKPMWWRMFDRAKATPEELRDDSGCIENIKIIGSSIAEKQSQLQTYSFDPSQECKLAIDTKVMFSHNTEVMFTLSEIDIINGKLQLKIGNKTLNEKLGGYFPKQGSLIPSEYVPATGIQVALTDVATKHLSKNIHLPVAALFERLAPAKILQDVNESVIDSAIRITGSMSGGCLIIQGPPGTGKTYTAAHVINALLNAGKKVGVASNSHKAIVNLLIACGESTKEKGGTLQGIKVGGDNEGPLFLNNPSFKYVKTNKDALSEYVSGVVGGTAWLFTLPEWEGILDFLFIDEAGQVSLANAVAMARCAKNIVLLGDQMQLEQPIQGTHPGDSGLSSLQYALKNLKISQPDLPVFHPVVPSDYGLFLGESRRMHPSVCRFISESIYEKRLISYPDCNKQKIDISLKNKNIISKEYGIIFSGVEHDGNIQQSEEEVERVKMVYEELLGCNYTATNGTTKPLTLKDFLFITPYNAQVRLLQSVLPDGARIGSVDKFQGQEAPVCILSLCSSYGEYGSRGLAFILDRNRINVAISRAQCLAVVVADPRIATATAGSIDEMMLLNIFCKLVNL